MSNAPRTPITHYALPLTALRTHYPLRITHHGYSVRWLDAVLFRELAVNLARVVDENLAVRRPVLVQHDGVRRAGSGRGVGRPGTGGLYLVESVSPRLVGGAGGRRRRDLPDLHDVRAVDDREIGEALPQRDVGAAQERVVGRHHRRGVRITRERHAVDIGPELGLTVTAVLGGAPNAAVEWLVWCRLPQQVTGEVGASGESINQKQNGGKMQGALHPVPRLRRNDGVV